MSRTSENDTAEAKPPQPRDATPAEPTSCCSPSEATTCCAAQDKAACCGPAVAGPPDRPPSRCGCR
jgi:hypothetical protein